MTKKEMINAIAEKAECTKKDAKEILDAAFDTIIEAVMNGDDVRIGGFGTFTSVERAARTGRNPHTGEALDIKASKAVKFKASKMFKDAVKSVK